MSYFDRQAIPEAPLRVRGIELDKHATSKSSDDKVEDTSVTESEDLEEDLMMLRDYSLIAVSSDAATFQMHDLVQVATQRWLKQNNRLEQWQTHFIKNLENGFPIGSFENWARCQSLFPHAMVVLTMTLTDRDTILHHASLLSKSGSYASEQGHYVYAEKMEALCVKLRQKMLGPEHPDTLTSMSNLASTLRCLRQYEQAAELGQQGLNLRTRVPGPEHPNTLIS